MSDSAEHRTWCDIDGAALRGNIEEFRRILRPGVLLAPVVKAGAYGHGLLNAARIFTAAGADWLCTDSLTEALELRTAGVACPLLVLGHIFPESIPLALAHDVRFVIADEALLPAVDAAARSRGTVGRIHVKVETGNNRQGLRPPAALRLLRRACDLPGVAVEGISTHFADIEDTTDHTFAGRQLELLRETATMARALVPGLLVHCANTAAAILWPEAHLDLARVGIGAYGMWPSKETFISALTVHRDRVQLRPALTWKTRIAQVKAVEPGETVGYGRTYFVTHPSRLAVLPVGYYDGYDRRLSNVAHVLVRGRRAPVRGRVAMNMTTVDVTDVPGVLTGDEVVLLGGEGADRISAEQVAAWMGTINYEVTTRIAAHVPRLLRPPAA